MTRSSTNVKGSTVAGTTTIKLKYDPWGRKFMFKRDERSTDWSDEESDYLVKPALVLPKEKGDADAEWNLIVDPPVSTDDGRLPQIHVKTNSFDGTPALNHAKDVLEFNKHTRNGKVFEKKTEHDSPSFNLEMPHIASHIVQSIGKGFLDYVWGQFCSQGANKFGMLKYKKACSVMSVVERVTGERIPFQLELDDDDYIYFHFIIDKVTKLFIVHIT